MKVADMHCDTIAEIYAKRQAGEECGILKNNLHIDLEKMERGDYAVQNFAVFAHMENLKGKMPLPEYALRLIDTFFTELRRYPDRIGIVRSFRDIEKNMAEGRMSALLTMEEGAICEGKLEYLRIFYELGVRMFTFTWNFPNELAYPNRYEYLGPGQDSFVPETEKGLTEKGFEFLEEMERLGYKPEDFKLRVGMFGSEASSDEMHAEIARKLHILPTDNYGLSELIGPGVSGECELKRGMHINEDHFYAELLDPETFEPKKEGEYGELVLTALTKRSMPMIRYRTKDITALDYSPCECGRTTARMAKLKGRTDDMLIIKGVNVFPSQIEGVLLKFREIGSTYEIVVTREDYKDRLEVRVEPADDSIVGDYGRLEKLSSDIKHALRSVLQIDVKLSIVEPRSLRRYEGKAKRVVDLRKY